MRKFVGLSRCGMIRREASPNPFCSISEWMKKYLNRGERPPLYFWRDSNGNEVDLIVDTGAGLMPIEIKSGQTVNRDFFTGLEKWMRLGGTLVNAPTLIYGGTDSYSHKGINIVAWNRCGAVCE